MMSSTFDNLQTAVSRPPADILEAVRDQFPMGEKLPPTLKWELLADTAHNRGVLALRHQQPQEGQAWIRLAIEVYDRLALAGDVWRRVDCRRSSMVSRATLISTLGADESDPYRSPTVIERWFF